MTLTRSGPRVFSVSEINASIHDLLENSFPDLWIEGEISNCRLYPSGHTYLTLKDAGSQISAVLFKGNALRLKFAPEDGLKVLVRARVSTYVKRGSLQIIISHMEPRDKGALQLAFEQLKEKLQKEGLFDEDRKKKLPLFPTRIGIVTSPSGAVISDILTILERRWPGLEITLWPVRVQGDEAKDEIAAAIAGFNDLSPETDLLIVGRGGGSIEDLWAFNEEVVARALAASVIPVISAVGHETDSTISDFVADVRAPTPSAAAELAVQEKAAVLEQIRLSAESMLRTIKERIANLETRLVYARSHPFLQSPHRLYEERIKRVDELSARLPDALKNLISHAEKDLRLQIEKLDAFSPLQVLSRGYSIAEKTPGGEIVRSATQVKPGDLIRLRLHEGQVICEVKQ